ncbi:hypothetical protein [Rhodoblastus sp.]|uniref:hypothetical protein n=1 Tax=Rhodoblastus sp. TaxID=1962975 RepID=UPI0035B11CF0
MPAALVAFACQAKERLTRSFGEGAGQGSVAISVDAGDDAEIEGPQAIYSSDSGEIYLLDQMNGRVLKFDPGQPDAKTQTLELPEDVNPTSLGGNTFSGAPQQAIARDFLQRLGRQPARLFLRFPRRLDNNARQIV